MTLTDLLGLLIGRRQSILNIARSRSALWVGLLLVFSAAMAREYDRHWLLAEWWHLLLPFGVSIALVMIQFPPFWMKRDVLAPSPGFWKAFLTVLSCYWMTAPLAWLYAIPYERFLPDADAAIANVISLAAVSALRGLIIARTMQVLSGITYGRALIILAGPAQVLVTLTVFFTPVPLFDVMSGIRYTPEESVLRDAAGMVLMETMFGGWVIAIASLAAIASAKTRFIVEMRTDARRASPLVWLLPIIVSVGFIALLPWTQPPWQRAYHADQLMQRGEIKLALQQLAAFPREQFPPDWRPLPKTSRIFDKPNLLHVLYRLETVPTDAWPRRYYIAELERMYLQSEWGYFEEKWVQEVDLLLDRLPEGAALRTKYAANLARIYERHAYVAPSTTQPIATSTTRAIVQP